MESLEFGINFPVNGYIDTWLKFLFLIYKVVFSSELVVTFKYTWEEYAGNQNKTKWLTTFMKALLHSDHKTAKLR